MTSSIQDLFSHNRAWAEQMERDRPGFFTKLVKQQKPKYMWIGCSDSRVPADIIVNALPGAIFAHRNIANQVIATDFNCLSVIQYAVQVLKVQHVIVCGHYNCGGVRAALDRQRPDLALLNKWLMHIKDIYRMHRDEIDALNSQTERANRLVEINVIEQVMRLSQLSIVQTAWKEDQQPMLHGWVFGLDDGILHQLITLPPGSEVDVIYQQHGGEDF
ncbi:MAG: carbonic anhydrase [Polaromonas sp.]|uniref:carbonic anhydrase n=1 Tax=Polaromonas sp. TaxID=1869339 RepID=UPI002736AFB2|nr:carbonic anhydrase [Polaromonas sp.]MDP3249500.1 carbonic anhydrase [Polaromonas sp.]